MNDPLNFGLGACQATASLIIKPIQAVIELGAAVDFTATVLHGVHEANRHGPIEDRIAAAFPEMAMGRKCMMLGREIELIGSESSLTIFLGLDRITTLKRRGMLVETQIEETFIEDGMLGAAYVRDRSCEKQTTGWIRRSMARADRRGKPVGKPAKPRSNDLSALVLNYGKTVLHIREQVGEVTSKARLVSTYGFSPQTNPAFLPVMPESARDIADAK